MSETSEILVDTTERFFADHITAAALHHADAGGWLDTVWENLEALGLPLALIPEAAGGFGLEMVDALELVRIAGAAAAPLPLAETMFAGWLLAGAGLALRPGPASVAPVMEGDRLTLRRVDGSWHLDGTARRVPWGRLVASVAVLAEHEGRNYIVRVDAGHWHTQSATNIAGEPRDTLRFDGIVNDDQVAPAPPAFDSAALLGIGATLRSLALAGAIARVLALTTSYAGERIQFGRSIGKFQAIQQNLAVLAGQAAAASAAAAAAAEAVASNRALLPIAAGKVRCGEAAGIAAAIAHQVHGAIGFTHEHMLHHVTRRLWAWREEFGNEPFWSRQIGRLVAQEGADRLWPLVTAA